VIKYYLVGGAVRDMVMAVPCKDYDFVVVGAKPSDFSNWKSVGNDFPVFLEPTNGWEVGLARTERKVGEGYTGFDVECNGVTLEQDLSRRDLTINAMAIEVDFEASVLLGEPVTIGSVIDPFSGIPDIKNKVLRCTTKHFAEDPLRVLRVARFMARFGTWKVASSTWRLMQQIYLSGELLNLVPERVWLETKKALSERTPSLYFKTLKNYDHLFLEINHGYTTPQKVTHHPEVWVGIHQELVVDYAAKTWGDTEINLACMLHDLGKHPCWLSYGNAFGHEETGFAVVNKFCDKWKVPNSYRNLALITCEYHTKVHGCIGRGSNDWMRPKSIMKLFEDTSALKKPEQFYKMLKACEADAKGRGNGAEQIAEFENNPYIQREYLEDCLRAVLGYDSKPLSEKMLAEGKTGVIIGQTIRQEKIKLIREVQDKWKERL